MRPPSVPSATIPTMTNKLSQSQGVTEPARGRWREFDWCMAMRTLHVIHHCHFTYAAHVQRTCNQHPGGPDIGDRDANSVRHALIDFRQRQRTFAELSHAVTAPVSPLIHSAWIEIALGSMPTASGSTAFCRMSCCAGHVWPVSICQPLPCRHRSPPSAFAGQTRHLLIAKNADAADEQHQQ